MKTLLVVPQRYGFYASFKAIFQHLGSEVYNIDFYDFVKGWEQKTNTQIFRLPNRYRLKWESYYFEKINKAYIATFDQIEPDIVFIYNNELLLPETLAYFKKKGAKIGFYLGDSPFYSPTNRYSLQLLDQADIVLAPDSFWIQQLQKIGIKNLQLFYPSAPTHQYYRKSVPKEVYDALKADLLYVGMSYTDSWGYKKAKFLNQFADFDLKIIGNKDWKRWFKDFPALAQHYKERDGYLSIEKMNDMYNAAKIIPIDGNPGIMHGVHWRMMEALCSGALPLMEWQLGLGEIFPLTKDLPAVHSYDAIKGMTHYYLRHDDEREETVDWMRQIVFEKFSLGNNADIIADALQWEAMH